MIISIRFRDAATARAVLDGPLAREFAALAAAQNIIVLAWAENGLRHITSNRRIRGPSDLKNFKLRVPPTSVMRDGLQALGADAKPYSFALGSDEDAKGCCPGAGHPAAMRVRDDRHSAYTASQ